MNYAKSAATAAALCLALAATGVYAAEPQTALGCLHMEKKTSAALSANQQSPNYYSASQQAEGARSFCAHDLYKMGIERYAKALELLGAS